MSMLIDPCLRTVPTGEDHGPPKGLKVLDYVGELGDPLWMLLCQVAFNGRGIHAPLSAQRTVMLKLRLQLCTGK